MKCTIPFFKIFLIIFVIVFITLNSVNGEELSPFGWEELPPLGWSDDIQPGISEAELSDKFKNMGIKFLKGPRGLTYSSKIITKERDYLFCNDRLYAIIEGVFAIGEEFNKWFQSFLTAHRRYGKPDKYDAEPDWGRFRAEWRLENGSTFYFQLQCNLKDKQGWSRQLYANDIGAPCK